MQSFFTIISKNSRKKIEIFRYLSKDDKEVFFMKKIFGFVSGAAAAIGGAAAFVSGSFFQQTFTVDRKRNSDPHKMPKGEQYDAVREESLRMVEQCLALPYEDVWAQSVDGLLLHGRYYEKEAGAPIEILFHGYRSNPIRDFCGGLQLGLEAGHNVLLVDQRAHGQSEGKCLTFGIMERKDCLSWLRYVEGRFGKVPVYLVGISMGASTVLMAASEKLPDQVAGIIADSGYTSPKEIICKVLKDRHYSPKWCYPIVYYAAKFWGHFDLEECSAEQAMKRCKIPVLIIHGGDDRFVPCEMSVKNYQACAAEDKKLLIVDGAGHGLGYVVDYEAYKKAVVDFI